jgi:hypothetical protein
MKDGILSLAVQGTLRKKKNSCLTFLVLLISVSFAIASLSLVESMSKTNAELRKVTYGEWYLGIPNGLAEDEEWLREQTWAETIGVAQNYGTISTRDSEIGFGTLDDAMVEVGRLRLDSGTWATEENEIVMEADSLSALGYDYTLGQEITLRINVPNGEKVIPVIKTYVLVGVLHEYTDLWTLSKNNEQKKLVSAVVSDAAAQSVLQEAQKSSADVLSTLPQYFIMVDETQRETAKNDTLLYMYHSRRGTVGSDSAPCENTLAYPTQTESEESNKYALLIAAITLLAVLCIYIMQLPKEAHRFATLRSIGITKGQLLKLLLCEALLIVVPALLLGVLLGALGCRLLLHWAVYAASISVYVVIPYKELVIIGVLWLLMMAVLQLFLFVVALHTPLIGRMKLQQANIFRARTVRSAVIVVLLCIMSGTTIVSVMESIETWNDYNYYSQRPHYVLAIPDFSLDPCEYSVLPLSMKTTFEQSPDIERVLGYSILNAGISLEGRSEYPTNLYVVDDDEIWSQRFSMDEQEFEAFKNGDFVLLCFTEDDAPSNSSQPQSKPVNLFLYNEYGETIAQTETTANVHYLISTGSIGSAISMLDNFPYTIICSTNYARQLIALLPQNESWGSYTANGEFGYDMLEIRLKSYADGVSMDSAISDFCKQYSFWEDNYRVETQAGEQENYQKLLLLYSAGACIVLVVWFILIGVLSLESEQEKRMYNTLRSLGMSKRQVKHQLTKQSVIRSLFPLVASWCIYLCYVGYQKIQLFANSDVTLNGKAVQLSLWQAIALRIKEWSGIRLWMDTDLNFAWVVALLVCFCLLVPFALTMFAKRKLWKGELEL